MRVTIRVWQNIQIMPIILACYMAGEVFGLCASARAVSQEVAIKISLLHAIHCSLFLASALHLLSFLGVYMGYGQLNVVLHRMSYI